MNEVPSIETLVSLILARLKNSEAEILNQWENPEGTKTKHFFIDNFLPLETAESIYEGFPKNASGFHDRESFREKKRTSANLSDHPQILGNITYAIQDQRVVDCIERLVGMKSLEPDPRLYAGGLSMMFKGDFLNPHIDNSHDGQRDRYRRLNLLYYVSPDWIFQNGGNFELWNSDRTIPKTITCMFNRFVVMETNKDSWHSVSPVQVDRSRCCVSNYFFSINSPDATEYFHVTSFDGRPQEKLKRLFGRIDNSLRNFISKAIKLKG